MTCRRQVPGTRLSWSTVSEWLDLVDQVGNIGRPSTPHYQRCARLYCSLSVRDLRRSLDEAALARAVDLLDRARHSDVPAYGLRRVWSREVLGMYLVEARNQLERVRSGRALQPRMKGPRLDPIRLPDAALERLIQAHQDMAIVEALRAERRRRQEAA